MLPHLHGLASDLTGAKLCNSSTVTELSTVLQAIQDSIRHATSLTTHSENNNCREPLNSQLDNSATPSLSLVTNDISLPLQQTLLPPSPERANKRRRSNNII